MMFVCCLLYCIYFFTNTLSIHPSIYLSIYPSHKHEVNTGSTHAYYFSIYMIYMKSFLSFKYWHFIFPPHFLLHFLSTFNILLLLPSLLIPPSLCCFSVFPSSLPSPPAFPPSLPPSFLPSLPPFLSHGS